jgi:hypothetical protein
MNRRLASACCVSPARLRASAQLRPICLASVIYATPFSSS